MPLDEKKLKEFNPTSGTLDGKALYSFIPIPDCKGEKCPVYNQCEFRKEGRCGMERSYVSRRFRDIVDIKKGIGDRLNELHLQKLDDLLTLEQQAFRLQIEAYAQPEIKYLDNQGTWKINPIYKEQREVIKAISVILKDFEKIWEEKFMGKKVLPLKRKKGETGDRPDTYYETMLKEG